MDFLAAVRVNNNRDWFEAHKNDYKEAMEEFNAFAEKLIAGIGSFDPAVRGLTVKDCTYRIYRDVRFSPNKDPYKTHMGVYVCRGGKKSNYAGYYFHVEPSADGILGGNVMTAGLYMPHPAILKSVRQEILDNGGQFESAVKKAKGFRLDEVNKLKRLPTGYTPGTPYDEYLKLKDIYVSKAPDEKYLLSPGLAEKAAADFRGTYDLITFLNRAVELGLEDI